MLCLAVAEYSIGIFLQEVNGIRESPHRLAASFTNWPEPSCVQVRVTSRNDVMRSTS